ncbi:putative periplasmic protein YibQ distant homology with nucleoside diphosphatase and polysaccharide deacetylase [Paramagnetospirillum magnetotacticum MS-1]|uniref:Putative periplasmic protein YibQ distant homology with nucleoside diphosphatase and polysaccharide deacetylase n=1 Tax=Paramagnetospirillum magnetotacticum MS-1 TaxID=272627 RepID=A0A0C2UZF2_PARME|nr:divergent polysaccharide deacetylase family protein [Paramagnetospirillum magnetotacticum]KIL98196.1 putative periplasmic protein YibQ distant homology with nucleoside diphosphatase and polysaccharide deacetylase [Paramagnetospirillum magnetotacticum MS-1]
MADDTHFDLEELDEDPVPEIVVEEIKPERKPLNLKPILIGLGILVAGGSLGGVAYLFTAFETRDVIGLMDVGENPPKLSFDLPGRGEPPKPGTGSGLLTPPVAPGAAVPGNGEILKALPDDTPSPDSLPPALAPANAPANASLPPAEAKPDTKTAALPPGDYVAEPESPVSKAFAPKPPPAVDSSGMPTQPNPRAADKPPSYEGLPERKGEVKALPPAPNKEMQKRTAIGDLPVPSPDGKQPWQVYARPWSGPADRGKVAVVVMDMGLDKVATEAAIAKLPPEVTLAFSPYAQGLDKWVKKARDYGHEVMMVLPADSNGTQPRDPGPLGMTNSVPPESNLARLEGVMSRGAAYTGLISLGDKFAASEQVVQMLGQLRDRGLLYVGPGAAPADRTPALAPVTAVADADLFREAIEMRLNQVSIAARTKGKALVVINPRPLSFDRLLPWLNDFDGQKLVIVPVSTLVQPPPAPGKS